ncbi:MAG: oligosaccharide flippase family protein [Tepidisphaeraceae bacterium]
MSSRPANPLSHAAIYLLARGLPGLVSFTAIPLYTRLLAPNEYGRYAMVIAGTVLINSLVFQWVRLSLTRFLAAHTDEATALKSTSLTTTLLLNGALTLIAAVACLLPIGDGSAAVIACGWSIIVTQSVFELCCELARGTIRPWHYMNLQLGRSLISIILGYALVRGGAGWLGPAIGLAIATALAVAYAWIRDWRSVPLTIDRPLFRDIAPYGMPVSITVALAIVIYSSDRFLIAWMIGEDAAGIYAVACDFATQSLTLPMLAVSLAAFPLALRAYERHGVEAAREQMRDNGSAMMAVGVPCVAGLAVVAPAVCQIVLGERFRQAALPIVPVIAFGCFLATFKAYHFDAAFQFAHKTIYQVFIVLGVAVLNIVANLLAIPLWGIYGSAGASVASYAVSIGLTIYVGRRHFAVPFPWRSSLQVLLAATLMVAALTPFRSHLTPRALAVQILAGATIYGTALLAMNFLGLRSAAVARLKARSAELEAAVAQELTRSIEPAPAPSFERTVSS